MGFNLGFKGLNTRLRFCVALLTDALEISRNSRNTMKPIVENES